MLCVKKGSTGAAFDGEDIWLVSEYQRHGDLATVRMRKIIPSLIFY